MVHAGETRRLSFADWSSWPICGRVSLSATGFYTTPKIHWDRQTGDGPAVLLFRLWRRGVGGAIDTLTGEYQGRARRHPARRRPLAESGDRHRPDRGRLHPGHGLADDRGTGGGTTKGQLRTHAPSTYKIPLARDGPADLQRARCPTADNREATDPPLQGGRRAAADAGDLGLRGHHRCRPQPGAGAVRCSSMRRRRRKRSCMPRCDGAALSPR